MGGEEVDRKKEQSRHLDRRQAHRYLNDALQYPKAMLEMQRSEFSIHLPTPRNKEEQGERQAQNGEQSSEEGCLPRMADQQ